jgi:uncharacterized membrane protein HdeD (DUF308 family)
MKKSNWVIFLVNGLIAILFGLLALLVPAETIKTITVYFGVILLLCGLIMFYFSYRNMQAKKSYLLLMAEAIFAVLIGAVIAFYPSGSLRIFLIMIGIWATIVGLLQIILSVQMKKKVSNHMMFTLNGVITLVFGVLLFYNPLGTVKSLFILIGLLAVVAGVILVYLAFKVKGIAEK